MKKFQLIIILFIAFIVTLKGQRVLTLDQALNEAFEKSPTIIQARLQTKQNQERLNAQRAALKSNFSLQINPLIYTNNTTYADQTHVWNTNENTEVSGSFIVQQPVLQTDGVITLSNGLAWHDQPDAYPEFRGFTNSLNLNLQQPLFTYNTRKLELKRLELNVENSKLNYALQELSIERQVTQAFYQVYQTQMSVNIAQEEYENRQKSYDIIKNKVDGGLIAKVELLQAELDMLSSKSNLNNYEVSLENDKDNFKQLLGIDLNEDIMVLATVDINPVVVDLQKAINMGLSNRLELRQREIDIENGQFDLIETKAINEFKGSVDLDLALFGRNEKLTNVYDKPTNNQQVNLTFNIPIFDWGEKKARIKATGAAIQASEYNLDDERVTISLNIRLLHRSLKNELNQIEIARKNVENAQLTYDINLEKYENGDLTSMDLNLVQNQLTQSKKNLTDALIQYKLELLNMKIQTLYDFEKELPIVPDFGDADQNKK